MEADATVTLQDPGHGMTPEDISRLYAQMARGGGREGQLFLADWNHQAALAAVRGAPERTP